jgi:thiamine kinase-like enzyme
VARVCLSLPLLGIDRRNEVACQEAAARLGLGPEPVHREDGILVSRYLSGRTLTADDLREPETVARVARLLRKLHDSEGTITGHFLYFCPFQTIRTYAATANSLGARLPANFPALMDEARELSRRVGPFRPTLCHNDLLPANLIDVDGRLWLVDWEYAGMGHPLFDLAGLSANAGLDQDDDARLLETYRGEVLGRDFAELHVFKAASALREALWALIQTVTSELDFDYHAYAGRNLEAFVRAREDLRDLQVGGP